MLACPPRVRAIADEIVRKEGGLSDDSTDAGGVTNHGVSIRYAKTRGLMFDLDHDGDVDADDIRLVSVEIASDAFVQDFYIAPGFAKLPDELQAQMTDYGVNSGPGQAVISLQRVVNGLTEAGLAADGGFGPRTQAAVQRAVLLYGAAAVNNALVSERVSFLTYLANKKPDQKKFVNGWLVRARSFLL